MVGRPRPFVHCRVTTHAAKGAPVEEEQRRRGNNKHILLFKDAIEGLRASAVKGERVTECRGARLARRPFLLAYSFCFPARVGEGAAAVDIHGASGVNSSHFLVVGGPGAYVGMSSAEVSKMNPVSDSLPLFSPSFVLTSPSPVSYFAF